MHKIAVDFQLTSSFIEFTVFNARNIHSVGRFVIIQLQMAGGSPDDLCFTAEKLHEPVDKACASLCFGALKFGRDAHHSCVHMRSSREMRLLPNRHREPCAP